jgi:hypothetical protein
MRRIKTILKSILLPSLREGLGVGFLPSLTGGLGWVFIFTSCVRLPELHLYDSVETDFDIPIVDLDLEVIWNYDIDYEYQVGYDITYDWKAEWSYGWDELDYEIFGKIGYTEPSVFNLRRYYTGNTPYAHHTQVQSHTLTEPHFQGTFEWGFWDLLVWNEVHTLDGVQSLHIDESSSLDSVTAYTNPSMYPSRYQAPRYTTSFWSPEALFAAYEQAVEINEDLEGFDFDPIRNVYVKKLNMILRPITYIYLIQVILHNNNGRITSVDGNGNLSGMARTTTLNTGIAGEDPITIYFNTRMKKDMPLVPFDSLTAANPRASADPSAERVDIVGGRLLSFGLCNNAPILISRAEEVTDRYNHYLDVTMQFNNGMDSTFVFDVTEKVRERYKGGVITVELNVDTVPIPKRSGGSGFNAVVKDYEDGGTYEFDM